MSLRVVTEEHPRCSKCGGFDMRKHGTRLNTERMEIVQQYECKRCHTVTTAGTFMGHRGSKPVLQFATMLEGRGFSAREVSGILSAICRLNVHPATVNAWRLLIAPRMKVMRGRRTHPPADMDALAQEWEALQDGRLEGLRCPRCVGTNLIKCGVRQTHRGPIQKYRCKDCNQSLADLGGWAKMQHPRHVVMDAVAWVIAGASLSQARDRLQREHGADVTRQSVLRWVGQFAPGFKIPPWKGRHMTEDTKQNIRRATKAHRAKDLPDCKCYFHKDRARVVPVIPRKSP